MPQEVIRDRIVTQSSRTFSHTRYNVELYVFASYIQHCIDTSNPCLQCLKFVSSVNDVLVDITSEQTTLKIISGWRKLISQESIHDSCTRYCEWSVDGAKLTSLVNARVLLKYLCACIHSVFTVSPPCQEISRWQLLAQSLKNHDDTVHNTIMMTHGPRWWVISSALSAEIVSHTYSQTKCIEWNTTILTIGFPALFAFGLDRIDVHSTTSIDSPDNPVNESWKSFSMYTCNCAAVSQSYSFWSVTISSINHVRNQYSRCARSSIVPQDSLNVCAGHQQHQLLLGIFRDLYSLRCPRVSRQI